MTKNELKLKKITLTARKQFLSRELAKTKVSDEMKAKHDIELREILEQLGEISELLTAPEKTIQPDVVEEESEGDPDESKQQKLERIYTPICIEIMNEHDYHYVQRHHCYYKRAKNGELEDVMPGSLSIAHPVLQSRQVHHLFDKLMVSQGRVHHEINYSFSKLPSDVLNLMKISPIEPIAPDATFKKEYFDLLVETATGDYQENIEHAERWMTWKYLHPSDYSLPALVLFKSGGAGKNLLFEMVNRIIWGTDHVCKVEGEDFFDNFNDDQLGTAVVFIDEMDFDKQNINKLKARVQQQYWKVNGKFKRRWEVDTTMCFIIATNDGRGGIRLSRDNVDRRWSIMKCKASLVNRYNQRFHGGKLDAKESAREWEKIAEGIIKDKRQVAMWLYSLIEKWGSQESKPSALHGLDYEEVCMFQKTTMHDLFDQVFVREDFDYISLETLFALSGIIHKDLHQGTYRQSSGAMLAQMIDEIGKAGLPIKYDSKKAFYNADGQARSKGWFYHERFEGKTLDENVHRWIAEAHNNSASMAADVNRSNMMSSARGGNHE